MIIRFDKYVGRKKNFLTPEMTGGPMRGALKAGADSLQPQVRGAVGVYRHALNTGLLSHGGTKKQASGEPYTLRVASKPGAVWNPGYGNRASHLIGISGVGVYFMEYGSKYTDRTHALHNVAGKV